MTPSQKHRLLAVTRLQFAVFETITIT